MNITNTLCNPTPWDVEWRWHAGIVLCVPGDGQLDLDVEVMDDFRLGKPGSEAVQTMMDSFGIFLRDPSRSYEVQALATLKACARDMRERLAASIDDIRAGRAAQGIKDEDSFIEIKRRLGLTRLEERVEVLQDRIKFLESHVKEEEVKPLHEQLDPSRTLLFLDPPKVFSTPLAMEMFLNEHPEYQAKQAEWMALQASSDQAGM